MEEVQRIADRITVLRDGTRVSTTRTAEIDISELISLMVGRAVTPQRRSSGTRSTVLLDVRSLRTEHISEVAFQVRAGEVLGIAGLVGSGRSEIGAALYGLRSSSHVGAMLAGHSFAPTHPAQAIRQGFCLLPEERRSEAIFPHMSSLENATVAVLGSMTQHGLLKSSREREACEPWRQQLKLAAGKMEVPIATLSGGNQQKAIMARWLLANPQVLFLDEPTRGIDIGAKEHIYEIIDELAQRGKGIILVSSELPELLRCCDRILVMHAGQQAGIVDAANTSQEEILALATGCMPA